MKNLFSFCLILLIGSSSLFAQVEELQLIYNWDDTTIVGSSIFENKYNEVWGFVQDGKEYAVIGSTQGTHFFQMDDIADSQELENTFVEGKATGGVIIHRDFHDYKGYLYAVADEGLSSLQIIKLDGLPNSTEVVYDSEELLRTTHNIFIDTSSALLYAMGGRVFTNGSQQFALKILSLEDPENPTLINTLPNQDLDLPYVHDGYIEEGIAYFNCGVDGLYIVDFTDPVNPVLLGSMTEYQDSGYNHSGWLHSSEPVYYLADENHGLRIKVVDVEDFSDIKVVNFLDAETEYPEESIPHNLIVMDNYLFVSYYFEGVQVYDVSDAYNPVRVAEYDTYPIVDFSDDFNGNWGVYPFPGSKRLIASDMRNGLFAFESLDLTNSKEIISTNNKVDIYPNPFVDHIRITSDALISGAGHFKLFDLNGKLLFDQTIELNEGQKTMEFKLPDNLTDGIYYFDFTQQSNIISGKLTK